MIARVTRLLALGLACVLAGACTTTSHIVSQPPATTVTALIKPGDTLHCTLRSGAELKFKVVRVEPDTLIGESQQVAVAELIQLKVTRFSPGKTLLLVVGLVGLGLAAEGVAEVGALGFPAVTYP